MAKTVFNQFVRIRAKSERATDLRRLLEALVAHTRAEDGPVAYDLFQSKADPTRFTIYEGWDSQDALDRHSKSLYFQETIAKLGELVVEWDKDRHPFVAEPLTMLTDRGNSL